MLRMMRRVKSPTRSQLYYCEECLFGVVSEEGVLTYPPRKLPTGGRGRGSVPTFGVCAGAASSARRTADDERSRRLGAMHFLEFTAVRSVLNDATDILSILVGGGEWMKLEGLSVHTHATRMLPTNYTSFKI